MNYAIVFLGAGIGGMLRYGMNVLTPLLIATTFPLHTFAINVIGSFFMGVVAEYFALRGEGGQSWLLFLTTGILGGFTTFSAFSLDAIALYERREFASAAIYVAGSVALSLAGLVAGLALMRYLLR